MFRLERNSLSLSIYTIHTQNNIVCDGVEFTWLLLLSCAQNVCEFMSLQVYVYVWPFFRLPLRVYGSKQIISFHCAEEKVSESKAKRTKKKREQIFHGKKRRKFNMKRHCVYRTLSTHIYYMYYFFFPSHA